MVWPNEKVTTIYLCNYASNVINCQISITRLIAPVRKLAYAYFYRQFLKAAFTQACIWTYALEIHPQNSIFCLLSMHSPTKETGCLLANHYWAKQPQRGLVPLKRPGEKGHSFVNSREKNRSGFLPAREEVDYYLSLLHDGREPRPLFTKARREEKGLLFFGTAWVIISFPPMLIIFPFVHISVPFICRRVLKHAYNATLSIIDIFFPLVSHGARFFFYCASNKTPSTFFYTEATLVS